MKLAEQSLRRLHSDWEFFSLEDKSVLVDSSAWQAMENQYDLLSKDESASGGYVSEEFYFNYLMYERNYKDIQPWTTVSRSEIINAYKQALSSMWFLCDEVCALLPGLDVGRDDELAAQKQGVDAFPPAAVVGIKKKGLGRPKGSTMLSTKLTQRQAAHATGLSYSTFRRLEEQLKNDVRYPGRSNPVEFARWASNIKGARTLAEAIARMNE